MAYTFHLLDAIAIEKKLAKLKAKNSPTFLEPQIVKPRIARLKVRSIFEHPDAILFNMKLYETTPLETKTPNDHINYLYRWIALNPGKKLPEKYIKFLLVCEAIERTKFKLKRRIKFNVNRNPELLQRKVNK